MGRSVFRAQKLRDRKVKILKVVILAFIVAVVAWSIFNIADAHAQQQASSASAIVIEHPYPG